MTKTIAAALMCVAVLTGCGGETPSVQELSNCDAMRAAGWAGGVRTRGGTY